MNTKLLGQNTATDTQSRLLPDINDIGLGQLTIRAALSVYWVMRTALCSSSLSIAAEFIANIVCISPDIQVVGIAARRIVAVV